MTARRKTVSRGIMGLVVVRLSDISPASDDTDANRDVMFSNVTVNDDDNVAAGAGVDFDIAASASATTIQTTDRLIGDVLIVGQCIMSALQDLAEELFMHEAELSPRTIRR